jgi:arylsulfatase A-like enzyme
MNITRRSFAAALAATAVAQPQERPNILWISCEDMGPHLHACGDDYSVTPHLDKLCAGGTIYRNAWSNAPVCAPARTTIITGVYPPSTGSEHMRSMTRMPAGWKLFPGYLRDAGYYTSNNVKEDYNIEKPAGTWDDSSNKAHWRKRASGQPFFSVFNFTITHESQIRTRPHTWVHDPAKVRVPAYHPDTPEVRQDWAQYYDNITLMDTQAGRVLEELERDGLAQDTIVIHFGDHGSGMPRSKRWPYNSGLNVAIVAYFPEKWKHLAPKDYKPGTISTRLLSFVDLAPSMLSLAGVEPPDFYQGQACLGGRYDSPTARKYVFGFRGRMDERYDCVRTVRNDRYVYVRNYMPHRIYGQHLGYMWETPTTRVWEQRYRDGKLNAAQRKFWEPKPAEELYDLQNDRDEINNLAGSVRHAKVLEELRKAHREHTLKIRDIGLLPEAEIHSRALGRAPYDAARTYPVERVFAAAEAAASSKTVDLEALAKDAENGVRYWSAMGYLIRKKAAPLAMLSDASPSVCIAAAESIATFGAPAALKAAIDRLVELADPAKHGPYVAMQSLASIDALGPKAKPWKDAIAALPTAAPKADARVREEYIKRLRESIAQSLG